MKKVLSTILLICVTVFAQELGLETDSGTVSSFEEELLLIGVDDLLIEDVVIVEDITEDVVVEEDSVDVALNDTASTVDLVIDSTSLETDTLVAQVNTNSLDTTSLDTTVVEEELVPEVDSVALAMAVADVKAMSSVDVEGSLEGYKSPRRAMFFSLAVPGAGQAYVGQYWKTGLFVALEAATIAGAVYYKKEGKDIQDQAYAHYDKRFSDTKLEKFLNDITAYGRGQSSGKLYESLSDEQKMIVVDSVVFGGNKTYQQNADSTAVQKYMTAFNSDEHKFARDETALQGWRDATPGYVAGSSTFWTEGTAMLVDETNFLHLTGGDTRYGSSDDRNRYIELLKDSDKQYDISRALVIGILVNHVASATDAYISAHRHNRELMNEENDLLSRISIDNQLYLSEQGELTTGVSLAWRF